MPKPLMPKATAVWLIDNTTLTFEQIGAFCGMHTLEVQAIADGDITVGMMGRDPVAEGELSFEEIARCASDPSARLVMTEKPSLAPERKKRSRYIPLSKRQDKPAAILWFVTEHPEVPDSKIMKLLSTTKATINSIRNGNNKNLEDLKPQSPVILELCTQSELDEILGNNTKAR